VRSSGWASAILLAASADTALCGDSTEGDLVVGNSGVGVGLSISGSAVLGHLGHGAQGGGPKATKYRLVSGRNQSLTRVNDYDPTLKQ
jgi:hypothetical protein